MRSTILSLSVAVSAFALAAGAGCGGRNPPPKRVPVPPVYERERVAEKPLPGERVRREEVPPPPFDDVPLVTQRPPEQRAYVEAYESVGRPRIAVLVRGGAAGAGDEGDAPPLDADAIESVLSDWLAADGRVEVISPDAARQRLDARQRSGDPQSNDAAAQGRPAADAPDPNFDVLVEVQARPIRRTGRGTEVRLITEAVNVRDGGRSIARAMVEVPPPLDKPQLNKYTRFLGRKLMDGMTTFWQSMAEQDGAGRDRPVDRRSAPPADGAPETKDADAGPRPQ